MKKEHSGDLLESVFVTQDAVKRVSFETRRDFPYPSNPPYSMVPCSTYVKVAPYLRDRNRAQPSTAAVTTVRYSSLRRCLLPTAAVLETL